ncbi:transmembrane protein, putative (macronuclear) [Tetrahymena thermophila SB210]|uniref:Transmembrane protein, putative n=1 Tax=Tetrahymena thermophila (strain SB210) TaxID=312017 RepID=W7WYV5_TETTS|nr:transmembrane protein, putative [Tetrahymena thermophila SB210]EWS72090.1 transmembrane protein, putative [Tetrahymena thermophila SB210]|eukprot:XP_012655401.1 transmembrane protein, putative [Tetrahymena thermophila SB210]
MTKFSILNYLEISVLWEFVIITWALFIIIVKDTKKLQKILENLQFILNMSWVYIHTKIIIQTFKVNQTLTQLNQELYFKINLIKMKIKWFQMNFQKRLNFIILIIR